MRYCSTCGRDKSGKDAGGRRWFGTCTNEAFHGTIEEQAQRETDEWFAAVS